MTIDRRQAKSRQAFSLIEVIVSSAIIVGSSIAILQLASLGRLHVTKAEEATRAQLLCQNKMAEVLAGIHPLEDTQREAFLDAPEWSFAVQVAPLGVNNIYRVAVSVFQSPSPLPMGNGTRVQSPAAISPSPVGQDLHTPPDSVFHLIRWIRYDEEVVDS